MITLGVRYCYVQSFTSLVSPEITRHDHSSIACFRHIYMGVILRAHPVLGESHIQHNANGEVATTSPPFYNKHDLHIVTTAPFWCDRKGRAACAHSFTLWQQATTEIACHDHSLRGCYTWNVEGAAEANMRQEQCKSFECFNPYFLQKG